MIKRHKKSKKVAKKENENAEMFQVLFRVLTFRSL